MAIPKYDELQKPFLELLKDGKIYAKKEIIDILAKQLKLSDADLCELLPSGKTVFRNRVSWAGTYLMKAGLIVRPARGNYQITPQGLNVLRENPAVINKEYLMQFPSFREFQKLSRSSDENLSPSEKKTPVAEEKTPDALLEESWNTLNASLADDLLEELIRLSPTAFEHLVTDLLCKMYGVHKKSRHGYPAFKRRRNRRHRHGRPAGLADDLYAGKEMAGGSYSQHAGRAGFCRSNPSEKRSGRICNHIPLFTGCD